MQDRKFKKILWAIDTIEEKTELQTKVIDLLQKNFKAPTLSVELCHVLVTNILNPFAVEEPYDWIKKYQDNAEASLKEIANKTDLNNVSTKVLTNKYGSMGSAADTLSNYAKSEGFDLIVLFTHARKGMARFIMGSFAETMLMHSEVPLLMLNPNASYENIWNRVLLPTNFTEASEETIFSYLEALKEKNAALLLAHQIPILVQSPLFFDAPMSGTIEPIYEKQKKFGREEMQKLASTVKKVGLETETLLSESMQNAADCMLKFAKEHHASLVLMNSCANNFESFLLGSTARKIVREAELPVLIVPRSAEKKGE